MSSRAAVVLLLVSYVVAGTAEAAPQKKLSGIASTYGWGEKLNKRTASGEVFDPRALTAASERFPLGTWVRVTDKATGKHVDVRINDKGPNKRLGREIDLSKGAWQKLGGKLPGLKAVTLTTGV